MSNESKSDKRRDNGLRTSLRKSYDTIPPQTGEFRNLFEEMRNKQNKIATKSQAQADSARDSSRRDISDE